MILVKPSFQILTSINGNCILMALEAAGRTCYKSENRITPGSAINFIEAIIARGHESVLEHESISVRIICDRGVSHEIVRHRLCAFSQESTRYCNYSGGVTFVIPPWLDIEPGEYDSIIDCTDIQKDEVKYFFMYSCQQAEMVYRELLHAGQTPQQARSVLPNSLKTEIVMTANLREWRHIFKLRTAKSAHPQMREIMVPLLEEMKAQLPIIFDDIEI